MGRQSRRKIAILGSLVLALAGGVVAYVKTRKPEPDRTGSERQSHRLAPSFALKDASGHEHRLGDLAGKAVVLHFWATWCPPCLDEIPAFLERVRKSGSPSVAWVAISLDDSWQAAHRFMPESERPKSLISLIDPERQTPEVYGSYQYPETYVLTFKDGAHRIAHKFVGAQEWASPEFDRLVEALASQ